MPYLVPSCYAIGTRVFFIKTLDLQPYTTVEIGELGSIVPSHDDRFVDIKLDKTHPGLANHDNTAWVCLTYDKLSDYVMPRAEVVKTFVEALALKRTG